MKLDKLSVYLCVSFLLAVPAFSNHSSSPQPFNSVAIAGHTQMGGAYCTCGCADGCICDPGEVPIECNRATPQPGDGKHTKPGVTDSGDGGALLLGFLFVMAVTRFLLR
jgi:hypothetical protein